MPSSAAPTVRAFHHLFGPARVADVDGKRAYVCTNHTDGPRPLRLEAPGTVRCSDHACGARFAEPTDAAILRLSAEVEELRAEALAHRAAPCAAEALPGDDIYEAVLRVLKAGGQMVTTIGKETIRAFAASAEVFYVLRMAMGATTRSPCTTPREAASEFSALCSVAFQKLLDQEARAARPARSLCAAGCCVECDDCAGSARLGFCEACLARRDDCIRRHVSMPGAVPVGVSGPVGNVVGTVATPAEVSPPVDAEMLARAAEARGEATPSADERVVVHLAERAPWVHKAACDASAIGRLSEDQARVNCPACLRLVMRLEPLDRSVLAAAVANPKGGPAGFYAGALHSDDFTDSTSTRARTVVIEAVLAKLRALGLMELALVGNAVAIWTITAQGRSFAAASAAASKANGAAT